MRPKRGSFKKYIRDLEGITDSSLPNGFYVGQRVYYLIEGTKLYGTVTDIPPPSTKVEEIYKAYGKENVVWCYFDHGTHWFDIKEELHRAS